MDGDLLSRFRNEKTFIRGGTYGLPNVACKISQLSSQEYLNQAGTRDNLHVVVSSPVTRILFKDEKNAAGDVVATGVEFVNEGKKYTARATREVILSSG